MLKLMKPAVRWLELPHGVRVEVEPLTTARATAARNEALRRSGAIRAEAEAAEKAGNPLDPLAFGGANAAALGGLAVEFEIEALARFGIRRWEGVAGPDGQPLPVTPDACVALAQHEILGGAFYAAYTGPLSEVTAEGEGLRPSAGSGGAGAASTAPDATDAPQMAADAEPVPAS
jgi:hypothetical protein